MASRHETLQTEPNIDARPRKGTGRALSCEKHRVCLWPFWLGSNTLRMMGLGGCCGCFAVQVQEEERAADYGSRDKQDIDNRYVTPRNHTQTKAQDGLTFGTDESHFILPREASFYPLRNPDTRTRTLSRK